MASFPSMHTSVATLTALHLYPSLGAWGLAFPAGAALGWAVFQGYRLVA